MNADSFICSFVDTKMEEGYVGACAFKALEVEVPLSTKRSAMVFLSRAKGKGHRPDMGFGQSQALERRDDLRAR